jgi:hypothetical protein
VPTTIAWNVAGTDSRGCQYSGAATIPGRASLTVWWDLFTYSHQVFRVAGTTAPVNVSCPGQQPKTVAYDPLNTNAAEADRPLSETGPPLSGRAGYAPRNAPTGSVDWSWSLDISASPGNP